MGDFEIKGNNKDIFEKAFKKIENIYGMKYEELKEKFASGKNLSPLEQEVLDKMNTLRAKLKLSSKRFTEFKKSKYLISKSAKNIEEEKHPLTRLKENLKYHYSSEHLKDSLKFAKKEAEGAGQSLYDLVDMNAKLIKGAGDIITNQDIKKDDLNPILLAISPLYYLAGKYSDDDVYAQMGERAKQIQGAINEVRGLKLTPEKVKELNWKYALKLSLEEWKKMAENTQGFEGINNPNFTPRERFVETIKNLPLIIKLLPQALKEEALKLYNSNNLEDWGTATGYTLFTAGASLAGPKNAKWNLSKFKSFPSARINNIGVNSIAPKEKILINLKKVVNKFPSVKFKPVTPKPIPPKLNKDEERNGLELTQTADTEEKKRLQKWIGDREEFLETESGKFLKQQNLRKKMEVNNYVASKGRKYVVGAPKEAEKNTKNLIPNKKIFPEPKEELKLPSNDSPTERLRLDRRSIDEILDNHKLESAGRQVSEDRHLWNLDTLNDIHLRIRKLENEFPSERELSEAGVILKELKEFLVSNPSSVPLNRVLNDLDNIEGKIEKIKFKMPQDLTIVDDRHIELYDLENTIKGFKEKFLTAYVEDGETKGIADKLRRLPKDKAPRERSEAPISSYSSTESIRKISEQLLAKDSDFSKKLGKLSEKLIEDSDSGFTKKLQGEMERGKLAYELDIARSSEDKLKLAKESAKPWVLRDLAAVKDPDILKALLANPATPSELKALIQDRLILGLEHIEGIGEPLKFEELERRFKGFEDKLKLHPRDPNSNDPKIKELLEKFKNEASGDSKF